MRAKTGGKSKNPDLPPAVIRITEELMLQQPNSLLLQQPLYVGKILVFFLLKRMIPIIADAMAKPSYKIPPMAINAMLYMSTMVDVPKILYLSTWVLPRHIKNVLATGR